MTSCEACAGAVVASRASRPDSRARRTRARSDRQRAGRPASTASRLSEMAAAPQPVSFNPWKRLAHDLRIERAWDGRLPGPTRFSVKRTRQIARDPLPMLLDSYREYGPVFFDAHPARLGDLLILSDPRPTTTSSGRERRPNFRWREGAASVDLIPVARRRDAHDRRRLPQAGCGGSMLPAFHRDPPGRATTE